MSWNISAILDSKISSDAFGYSVSIDGNYAIVGAPQNGSYKGKVYWYERRNNGKWVEMHHEEGKNDGDYFGWSVAIHGNYAIVGSHGYPGGSSPANKGKVYWYERRNNGKWVEIHHEEGKNDGDEFGYSVAISGNYAIVGSPGYPGGSSPLYKGKVYWYERQNNGKWVEMHHEEGKNDGDYFGYSVSISGNYAIVGSNGYPNGDFKGKVYWYERQNNGKWVEMHHEEGKNDADEFGDSVAISGNYAIVGSNGYPNGDFKGKVYWYERQNNGKWVEMHHEEGENDYDEFGSSVAIHGNYAIASAEEIDRNNSEKDYVKIYKRKNNGKWEELTEETTPIPGELDFGDSVSISENYIIVGGNGEAYPSGAAVIYKRENNYWMAS